MTERKDAPSSILTGREASTGPTPSTEKSVDISERDTNNVDVPPLNIKSTEKSDDISEESAENVDEEKEDRSRDSKKRKRYNAVEFKARYKSLRARVEAEGSEVPAHTESAAVGDGTPVANPDGNAESLHQHLHPTVSELCNILKFSEGANIIAERFLKFVVGDFDVSKEDKNILQALMISVCWICSSLSKHTIDRKESLTLATEHLNFSCNEEEADQVYEKLKKPKEMFLQNPINLKLLNAFRDGASPAVPLNPQEQKRENHDSANKEALQSSRQILEEDIARKERNEIDKFDREWREKNMNIVIEFELEKTLIRYLYNKNSPVKSGKLNLVEKEFADELNKYEKLRHVVVDDEISLNKPANETQILDLEVSEKEDQESRDKPVHDLSPVVVPDGVVNLGDSSNDMVSGSHTSEKHMANATVLCEPNEVNDGAPNVDSTEGSHAIQDPPNETGHIDMSNAVEDPNKNGSNDVARVDVSVPSEPIGDIPAIEETVSEQQDDVANVVSRDDALVSSDSNKNGSHDTSLHADSDQMGIPAANYLTLHIEYANGSHDVEDPTPNVESAELGILASNCNQDKAHDTTPSVQQVASPVFDHSTPENPEIHNDSNLLQQPLENVIQDQEGHADQIIPEDSSLNPHDEPSLVISTNLTTTENQAAMPSTSEVLVQTTTPPITAQAQRNANSNQAPSLRTRGIDPLYIELVQLSSVKEKMVKSHHDNVQKIKFDYKKEITEAFAEIKLKYSNKYQETSATFKSQKKDVENTMFTVAMNRLLAASFRRKYQNTSGGSAAVQQARQPESMQQQRMFRGSSTYSPGQSSGTQQTRPPLRPPPNTNPTSRLQHRRPPIANLIIPSITTNRPPPMINPITPSTPTITPITPSTTPSPIRSPHGMNLHTASTTPSRLNPFGMSSPPWVSNVMRGTHPHMRPFHHVTSSLPFTSPSNSQRLNSPSSIQTPPPLPRGRFPLSPPPQPPPSQLLHASAATSAHSSLPCSPSVPHSGGPQDELNDNVNLLTDNAAREFLGGGNGAQPPSPSAHEVVYLSDDD